TVSIAPSGAQAEVPLQVRSSTRRSSGALLSPSLSRAFRQQQRPPSTLPPVLEMVAGPATKFLRDMLLPKAKRGQRRMQPRGEIVSFSSNGLALTKALQSLGDSCGMSGKIDTVDITRSRQIHREFLLNATRMRRKKQNAIAQTCRVTN